MVSKSILTTKKYSHAQFTNIYESKPALADWLTLAQPRHTLPSLGGLRKLELTSVCSRKADVHSGLFTLQTIKYFRPLHVICSKVKLMRNKPPGARNCGSVSVVTVIIHNGLEMVCIEEIGHPISFQKHYYHLSFLWLVFPKGKT